MKIKGAIFDMDGTLVNSLMYWDEYWKDLGKKFLGRDDFKPSEDDDRKVRTMVFSDAMEYIRTTYSFPVPLSEILKFSGENIHQFYLDVVKCKDGAVELLEYLKNAGIKICLASATQMEHVLLCLKNLDLEKYFQSILSCADIGVGKDKPDIYLLALEKLALAPDEVCVFEDSYVALETAKSIGCKTIGIFDKYNYGQDRLEKASDIYVKEGESLNTLIEKVTKN